ncbi:MAG: P1 family peptidase [Salaquimonas sp.]
MKMQNLITDVEGLTVGNASDEKLYSGTTAVLFDQPAIASCHVMGGAPGTRDTDLLSPENTVETVDGLFLSGGSAFGLDAGTGVQAALREMGRGFELAGQRIPIVPGAILFDLINGGDKDWGIYSPYRELGLEAAKNAAKTFELGSAGAGLGATVAGLKGGLGSASTHLKGGATIGALVAVNALGSPLIGSSRHFHAALFEKHNEFGGLGLPSAMPEDRDHLNIKFRETIEPGTNTTLGIIATDMALTKAEAKRLAIAAHDGFARALWPAHTPLDGDIIFAVSTGTKPRPTDMAEWIDLCALASSTMARAIARGTFEAKHSISDAFPCWRDRFPNP